jgi:kynurenine formamidase
MHVSTHADAHPHYTQKSKETVCQLILSNLYFYVLLSKTNKPTKQNKTKNQQQQKTLIWHRLNEFFSFLSLV